MGMKKYQPESAFKWPKMKEEYMEWWSGLTLDQQVAEKKLFEEKRLANNKRRFPFPDMKDLTQLRLSQLSDRHIYRIWVFRERTVQDMSKP